MKLVDNAFSPFAFKVRVALYEKGPRLREASAPHRRRARGALPQAAAMLAKHHASLERELAGGD